MAESKQRPAVKESDEETESESDRALPVLWSDVQRADADKVPLLCGKATVQMVEPQE